jgi:hypothetical protein
MVHNTIFPAVTRSSSPRLFVLIGDVSTNADVLSELSGRKSSLEHLIYFFERAVLNLWQVEVNPNYGDEAGWTPYPAYTEVNGLS